jgi:hypothetical protein
MSELIPSSFGGTIEEEVTYYWQGSWHTVTVPTRITSVTITGPYTGAMSLLHTNIPNAYFGIKPGTSTSPIIGKYKYVVETHTEQRTLVSFDDNYVLGLPDREPEVVHWATYKSQFVLVYDTQEPPASILVSFSDPGSTSIDIESPPYNLVDVWYDYEVFPGVSVVYLNYNDGYGYDLGYVDSTYRTSDTENENSFGSYTRLVIGNWNFRIVLLAPLVPGTGLVSGSTSSLPGL